MKENPHSTQYLKWILTVVLALLACEYPKANKIATDSP